ncbi:Fe-S cluster assembly protein SufD [Desnuesiella massiliensis]|uniref:Fe-S cluster assembly protein SufD n=1 Tax=Desnuesiella massiliensis TaxID=1650662 RepID=UPI0006E3F878|nr:Fe-S cluster assembly protein SufD [Desnuesiella massiliensis]
MKEARNFNRLPVITWRWLKVNELTLNNYVLPEIKDFSRNVVEAKDIGNVIVKQEKDKVELFNNSLFKDLEYGVSKEFVDYAEKFYNTALIIHAPKKEKALEPIRIKYEINEENSNIVSNTVITAEEHSEITVIIECSTEGEIQGFYNGITKIIAKDGAKVNLIKVQTMNDKSDYFDSNIASIGYGAKVNFISVELGGNLSITNYVNNLEEPTGECDLKSIYLGDKNRTIDMSYRMNHKAIRTLSNIETRGVLMDKCKKTFRGTLDFKKGSTRSKASEEEYVILLSPTAKSDAIPLLLCDEDDVEGAHAASAGKIDENKLFYLMSRGFNEKEAKKLIVEASFRPIIDCIPDEEIKQNIEAQIQRRLLNE